jgi:hypothetical protein
MKGEGVALAAAYRVREKKAKLFRVFVFVFPAPFNCKIAPLLCVLKAAIYRQNIVLGLKIGPSTFSFFVNFDFSYFFVFF